MKYHSKTKVKKVKSFLINLLYNFGIKPNRLVGMFGVSRATIYRHIKK